MILQLTDEELDRLAGVINMRPLYLACHEYRPGSIPDTRVQRSSDRNFGDTDLVEEDMSVMGPVAILYLRGHTPRERILCMLRPSPPRKQFSSEFLWQIFLHPIRAS